MRIPSIPCALLLAASLTAQTTTTLIAETDVGVFLSDGTNSQVQGVASRTPILPGTPLNLGVSGRALAASATCGLSTPGTKFSVAATEKANVNSRLGSNYTAGTTAATAPRNASQGPHSYLLTVTGATYSSLDVTLLSSIAGQPRAVASVDIGADGKVEFSQAADGNVHRKSFTFTGTSVQVRITMSGLSSPGNDYDMTVIVAPSSPGCLITSYGTSCPNTLLTGSDAPASGNHVVTLDVSGALPSAPIWWVIGSATANSQIPASPCFLYTNPLIILASTADSLGKAKTTLQFSTSIKGTGYLQAIPFDPKLNVIFASNGLRFDCF